MVTITYEKRDPAKLKNHPLNQKLYGDKPDHEFVEDIKRNGILEALIITPDNLIVSGHRRNQAAKINKLKEVPVLVRRDLKDKLSIEAALIHCNRQREKTAEQKAREYERLKEIESGRAAERQSATKFSPKKQPGGNGCGNFPQPSKPDENGKNSRSSETAAEAVGMSRKTAEKAVAVVHAIDEAEDAGDVEKAEELRETLNEKSVAAAHRKATEKPEPQSSIVKDSLDRDVPKRLSEKYGAAQAINSQANKLDAIKREVLKLAEEPGGEFISASRMTELFKTLKGEISQARYWTECPRCNRANQKCDRCDGHGYIPYCRRGMLSSEDKAILGL